MSWRRSEISLVGRCGRRPVAFVTSEAPQPPDRLVTTLATTWCCFDGSGPASLGPCPSTTLEFLPALRVGLSLLFARMVHTIPEPASGTFTGWHRFWRSTLKLGKQDWKVASHELSLRQLERAVCCAGLDICNCACLEDVVRQVQTVEYAHLQSHQDGKGKGRFGISEEAALFAGTHRKSGDHMVCPDLLDSVNREVVRHHEPNL